MNNSRAPLTREDADWAVAPYDQDRVGLKGHFNFDIDADENDALHQEWPLEITRRLDPATGEAGRYTRPSYLLPKFYLSVRVMKCPKGKKALIPKDEYLSRHSTYVFRSPFICSEAYNPDEPKEYHLIPFSSPSFMISIILPHVQTALNGGRVV